MSEMGPKGKQDEIYPEFINGVPVGEIIRSLKGIHHGYVQIIIQDSKIVQIDRTEKKRIIRTDTDYSI